jgi:formate--tetrahydrofolate ligase
MAKVPMSLIDEERVKKSRLILVTAISPTKVGIGKTTVSIGLSMGFTIRIRDVILNCGSEMIVAIAGDMLRMPGLPKSPQAERITIVNGEIEGLS